VGSWHTTTRGIRPRPSRRRGLSSPVRAGSRHLPSIIGFSPTVASFKPPADRRRTRQRATQRNARWHLACKLRRLPPVPQKPSLPSLLYKPEAYGEAYWASGINRQQPGTMSVPQDPSGSRSMLTPTPSPLQVPPARCMPRNQAPPALAPSSAIACQNWLNQPM
jgi:hypothetical protein